MPRQDSDLTRHGQSRREFIKNASAATAAVVGAGILQLPVSARAQSRVASIVLDAADPLMDTLPVQWATAQLRDAHDPLVVLKAVKPVRERPANEIRGVARSFVSDVEDKTWYQDRDFWPPYLTMLVADDGKNLTSHIHSGPLYVTSLALTGDQRAGRRTGTVSASYTP